MALRLEKVLISDTVDESCLRILKDGGVSVDYRPGLKKDKLLSIIAQYDGLIVRSGTKVTAEVIAAGTRLRVIGRAGTGVDNIDIEAATENGVVVMNTPAGNTISAAELTCALISCTARNIPQGHASLKAGKWDRNKYKGVELQGKTLGIVGLGRIGREVATRMQSFGMRTVGYDPLVPAEIAAEFGVEFMELESIWPIADFITVHTPLIPATTGLLNDKVFAKCKRGVRVVNVARGGIIDEGALLRALESGQCGGAGLDVYTQEPPTDSCPKALVDHEKVVATPHLGASTAEAQLKVAQEVAQQFVDAQQGKGLVGLVNAPYLTNALRPSTEPWLRLATSLGRLAAGLLGKQPTSVTVVTIGAEVKTYGGFVLPGVLVGALDGGGVNLVNILRKAKGLGVQTKRESKEEDRTGEQAIEVGVSVADEPTTLYLQGTVQGATPILQAMWRWTRGMSSIVADVGLLELSGNVMVYEGSRLADVATSLEGITQVTQAGEWVVAKVTTLPAQHTAKVALSF